MTWQNTSIWWHLFPLGFCGAPSQLDESTHTEQRLLRIIDWLDYAVDLGVNGLLLGPIFRSQSHGYDSLDQFQIDPRLGTREDANTLFEVCKRHNLRILLDGVFNHVGNRHPWFDRAMREGPHGEFASFFRIDWSDAEHPRAATFEGHPGLVALNHDDPRVVDYVADVMTFWLERGVDGWRLDAAYAVNPGFWAKVIPMVRTRFPEAMFVGEVIHGDYSGIVAESRMDTVTQYELWKAIWSSIQSRNFFELDWALQRHNQFLDHFTPYTFIGNHDVTRIASQVGEMGLIAALTILFTVGGHPSIYYGDEQGFVGIKENRVGGDDAIRPAFPAGPSDLAPWGWWIYEQHRRLVTLRKHNPWLVHAHTERVELKNTRIVYRVIDTKSSASIQVEIDWEPTISVTIRGANSEVLYSFSGPDN